MLHRRNLFPKPSEPVRIKIDQIILVVASKEFTAQDFDRMIALELVSKKAAIDALNNHVKIQKDLEQQKKDDKNAPGFVSKLVASIVNNIQVRLMLKCFKYSIFKLLFKSF